MLISEVSKKMISYSEGNVDDINHFMKVYSFAKVIADNEISDYKTLTTLEIAALIHDIACPLCREKYGDAMGKHQEIESPALVKDFLKDFDIEKEIKERVEFLVSHHHTYTGVDGPDYQILLEADYIVNADEGHMSKDNIKNMYDTVFKTETGRHILKSMYL